jgi:glycosyltransferase involved in cell wall biosynthesis
MVDTALGVTVFDRVDRLRELLESVNADEIDRVIVADNGHISDEKSDLYNSFVDPELTVLDLKYDSGLGYCRNRLVETLEERFLLVVDSDVVLPNNVSRLRRQLYARPELGGVGGILWEDDQLRSNCYDLYNRGDVLIRDIKGPKQIHRVAGGPLVEFDVIQNVAMFRRKCLEEYAWDPEYKIGWEHTDFFVGHDEETDWEFAVNPDVLFKHNPGGDTAYQKKRRGQKRLRKSKRYFLEKWGYEQVANGQVTWLQTNDGLPSSTRLLEQAAKCLLLKLPSSALASSMAFRDYIRSLRGKPPF